MNAQMTVWLGLELLTVLLVACSVAFSASWKLRRFWASLAILSTIVAVPFVVLNDVNWMSLPVIFTHLYMLFHLLRVFNPILPSARLRKVLLTDQIGLTSLSIAVTTIWDLLATNEIISITRVLSWFCAVVSVLFLYSVLRNLWQSRRLAVVKTPTANLPTVSILIAARNEHHAIRKCLKAALASDYPKLEIIVLDDCSQDATDAVVRTFAHDGVRFIEGELPAHGWQARNLAFDKLLDEASGEYVAFAGVDVRLSPQSVRSIIQLMVNRKIDMVSIMPHRRKATALSSLLLLPRNFWLLAWPRSDFNPASISTFWVAKRQSLLKLGGFDAVRASVSPERFFARHFAMNRQYRFLAGEYSYGLTTRKKISSQIETEIRNLYPTLHRSVARSAIASLAIVAFLVTPFIAVWLPIDPIAKSIWALSIACLVIAHMAVYYVTIPKTWVLGLINFPLVVIIEWVLLHISMYRYEFGEVLWKGRNVCEPIHLRPIPHLPPVSVLPSKSQEQS